MIPLTTLLELVLNLDHSESVLDLTMEDFFRRVISAVGADYLYPLAVHEDSDDYRDLSGDERFVGFMPGSFDNEWEDGNEDSLVVPAMMVGEYVDAELADSNTRWMAEAKLGPLREALARRGSHAAGWDDRTLLAYYTVFHELGHTADYASRGLDPEEAARKADSDLRLIDEAIERAERESGFGTPEFYRLATEYQASIPAERTADGWALEWLPVFLDDPLGVAFEETFVEHQQL